MAGLWKRVDRIGAAGERTGDAVGTLTVIWDASGIPSGVYIYRLNAGESVQTRRMVLIK